MISLDDAFVMIKSRIWPESWVGKEICWFRLKLSSTMLKRAVFGSSCLPIWMQKSRTQIISTFEIILCSSNDSNWGQKAEIGDYVGR